MRMGSAASAFPGNFLRCTPFFRIRGSWDQRGMPHCENPFWSIGQNSAGAWRRATWGFDSIRFLITVKENEISVFINSGGYFNRNTTPVPNLKLLSVIGLPLLMPWSLCRTGKKSSEVRIATLLWTTKSAPPPSDAAKPDLAFNSDLSESRLAEPLSRPNPKSACANGRTLSPEPETRGPKRKV